jgi:predicted nucleotidyltransferase
VQAVKYRAGVTRGDLAPDAADRLASVVRELPEVRLAFLFGSRAHGQGRPDSDVDIGLLLDDEAAGAERGGTIRRLAGRLGKVVSSALLDIVVLNDASALLRQRVLRDGVLLHERVDGERVRFAVRTTREYQDGQVRRDEFTRRRIRRLTGTQNHGGPGDLLKKARGVARLLGQAGRVS